LHFVLIHWYINFFIINNKKINVQFLGKNEKRGTNHEHNVYLHVKLSDGYVVVGKVKPFRLLPNKDEETRDSYKPYHPLYFRFSHTSGMYWEHNNKDIYNISKNINIIWNNIYNKVY